MELSPELIRSMIVRIGDQPLPNRVELAEIFGVTERTILDWTREGMPAVVLNQRGSGNEYPLQDCVIWLLSREFDRLTRETPKDRDYRLAGDMKELVLAEKMGLLAPAAEYEKAWTRNLMACRAELLNLGPRLAARLTAVLGVHVEEDPIIEEVEKALLKLSLTVAADDESDDEELAYESESEV